VKSSTFIRFLAASAAAIVGLAACGGDESSSECPTISDGKLTIGTGNPAYYPWVADDAPESKQGFEAAVAYAVAGELGYADADVVWVRTGFDEAIQPGAKNFDFNLQQFSITEERKATVSFSEPYYSTNQSLVGYADSAIATATSISQLKDAKFGAQAGTTSLDFITNVIQPNTEPFVYDDNAAAKAALEAKQIDAIVVDLPTAFYISAVEIEGSAVIGQFPLSDAVGADNFGLVFDLDNPLVTCVNEALASLKESGKLAGIENEWLSGYTGAPIISLD